MTTNPPRSAPSTTAPMPIERWVRGGVHGTQWFTHHWLSVAFGVLILCLIIATVQDFHRSRGLQGLRKTSAKRALSVKVAARLGWKDAAEKFVETWPRDPSAPNAPVVFRHPPQHVLRPTDLLFVTEVLGSLLGGSWSHQPSTRDALHNRVTFTRDAPPATIPTDVVYVDDPKQPIDRVPFARDENDQPIVADLTGLTPHILISASTGFGKTSTITVFVAHIAARGGVVDICDPKRVGFSTPIPGLAGLPNTRLNTTIPHMIEAVTEFHSDMEERYRLLEAGADLSDEARYPLRLLVIDEAGSFIAGVNRAWDEAGGKGNHPVLGLLMQVLWQGRHARFHVITAAQQANAAVLVNSDARDQYGLKIAQGPQSASSWSMLFGTEPRPPKQAAIRGRAVVGIGPQLQPGQIAHLGLADARRIAARGTGRHPRLREGQSGTRCEGAAERCEGPDLLPRTPESAPEPLSLVKNPDGGSACAEPKPSEPVKLTCVQCGDGFTSRSATVAQCPHCDKRQRIPASLRRSTA